MVVGNDCACVRCKGSAAQNVKKLLLLVVVGDHDTSDNSGDDSQQEDEKTETDPPLFASSSCGHYRLICVLDTRRMTSMMITDIPECDIPLGSILLNVVGRILNIVY